MSYLSLLPSLSYDPYVPDGLATCLLPPFDGVKGGEGEDDGLVEFRIPIDFKGSSKAGRHLINKGVTSLSISVR